MKRLISLIASTGILFGCATMPKVIDEKTVFRNMGIPERFENYLEKTELVDEKISHYDGGILYIRDYSDGKIFVRESRDISQIFENGIEAELYPSVIAFDLDGDFVIEEDEILVDEAADGINGNEIWLRDMNHEARYSKL